MPSRRPGRILLVSLLSALALACESPEDPTLFPTYEAATAQRATELDHQLAKRECLRTHRVDHP